MFIDQSQLYICWSSRLLPIILNSGFELWKDPEGKMDNPYLDMVKRYDKDGNPINKQKTGYIFVRTSELMELVGKHSFNKK